MEFFNGKVESQKLDKIIYEKVSVLKKVPTLLIIQFGNNPSSCKYVSLKETLGRKLGIPVSVLQLAVTFEDSKVLVESMSSSDIGGIIVQLSLPENLNYVLNLIPLKKDLDLLSDKSLDLFYKGNFKFLSPVVRAFIHFLTYSNLNIQNKEVIIIGEGSLVGKPLAFYSKYQGASVKIITEYKTGTPIQADLLILSAGVPNLVNGEDICKSCCVVDFGSSIIDNKTVGDLNLNSSLDHLDIISPSPGGMGPLVVRYLFLNLLDPAS